MMLRPIFIFALGNVIMGQM